MRHMRRVVVISCLMSRIPTLKYQKRNFNGSVYCAYNDTVYEILYEFASHLGGRERALGCERLWILGVLGL